MTTLALHIRRAHSADREAISSLLHQLGYEATPAHVAQRLAAIQDSPADLVLVATQGEAVIGCIGLHILPMFHASGCLGRITSLVIDEACRGRRVGSALMDAAADWFAQQGCVKMEVTSGNRRLDAHRFYEAHGMTRDSQRFAKAIEQASDPK